MPPSPRAIQARLEAARLAIYGALENKEILSLLAARSYDEKALKAGKALYEQAQHLSLQVHTERAEQYEATDQVYARWASMRKEYAEDLALARVEFEEDRGPEEKLGLDGARARSFGPWLAQVQRFYKKLGSDAALAARLEPLGLTKAVLKDRQATAAELEALRLQQLRERAEARELTRKRRKAMAELDRWMRRFTKVARIALKEHPQWLEQLGLNGRL